MDTPAKNKYPSSYPQQYLVNSYRVAPLRAHTEGFTSSYPKIYRNNIPKVSDLKNVAFYFI